MKKFSLAFVLLCVSFFILLFSCKKINESTELGGDILPDNLNTFELNLDAQTSNNLFGDSTRVGYYDDLAAGDLNDPEFGHTHAGFDFKIVPSTTGTYPFIVRDSLQIDSVVLQLAYVGAYGDTTGTQTVRVFEVDPGSSFHKDSSYKYADPSSDFPTTGSALGTATFIPRTLKDSVTITRPKDTTKVANVLRIKFNNTSLGQRFAQYDTAKAANGGFYSDSIFLTLFKGLAIKSDNSGNVLSYFSLSDVTKSRLMIYFRAINNGDTTYSSANFVHDINGQSNYIQRQHSSNVGTGGANKLYIQSTPGSYATIKIPGLDTLKNKVIHRAEIIATSISSAGSNMFWAPPRLLLDRINSSADSAYLFEKDLILSPSDGSIGYGLFGGTLRSDNTYRFNITRYAQAIITRKERNDILRLWAPLRAYEFDVLRTDTAHLKGSYVQLPVNDKVAEGRVVLGGGNYSVPAARLRMRIVYSNL